MTAPAARSCSVANRSLPVWRHATQRLLDSGRDRVWTGDARNCGNRTKASCRELLGSTLTEDWQKVPPLSAASPIIRSAIMWELRACGGLGRSTGRAPKTLLPLSSLPEGERLIDVEQADRRGACQPLPYCRCAPALARCSQLPSRTARPDDIHNVASPSDALAPVQKSGRDFAARCSIRRGII
jgi:hypothetical protein